MDIHSIFDICVTFISFHAFKMSKLYWLYLVVSFFLLTQSSFHLFFSLLLVTWPQHLVLLKFCLFFVWTHALSFFAFAIAVCVGSLGLGVSTNSIALCRFFTTFSFSLDLSLPHHASVAFSLSSS